jgi:hypothetical protein
MSEYPSYLIHYGVPGQKWGERRWQNDDGSLTPEGYIHYYGNKTRRGKYIDTGYDDKVRLKKVFGNHVYNKRHFDTTLKADKERLQTLSYDENRTKNVDMFYASHKTLDNNVYKALLNQPVPKDILDEDGNVIGTGMMYRKAIINTVNKDVKVASEDSAAKHFGELYKNDRDFYNFVTDENRMRKYFVDDKYKFKGYRESRDVLEKMDKDPKFVPDRNDIQKVYRMFNYVIPYDGGGTDKSGAEDVRKQRAKFFNQLSNAGYGACLDTNDSIYNGLKASSPVIVFDMNSVVPKEVRNTSIKDRQIGIASLAFRKTFGV